RSRGLPPCRPLLPPREPDDLVAPLLAVDRLDPRPGDGGDEVAEPRPQVARGAGDELEVALLRQRGVEREQPAAPGRHHQDDLLAEIDRRDLAPRLPGLPQPREPL